jgi:hypothetical protein
MKKQDLLNDLSTKFASVVQIEITEELNAQDGKNIKTYFANVLDRNKDKTSGVKRNISFYIINEGLADEEALYQNEIASSKFDKVKEEVKEVVEEKIK